MAYQVPGMTPEVADAARDVLALVRTELNRDREGEEAIIGSIDRERAILLLRMTADLAASLLRAHAGERSEEYLGYFAREFLS